jgi:hypothetical protein
MIFGFLPRIGHDELKQGIAAQLAAQETLDAHGVPTTPEAIQAANAMKTQLEAARLRVQGCMREVIANAQIFLGGGNEVGGIELVDKVNDGAADALHRLFPRFAEADHANWAQVRNNARGGNVGALQAVGYQGETVRHPVCKAIYDFIGAGKKGREVREQFKGAPFGWPQDAVDAALVILTLAGNLRAAHNGQPIQATGIGQDQIGVVSFHVDIPPLTVVQRLDLKALFQKLAVATQNGQESAAAATFLVKLLDLATAAGGESPCPEAPAAKPTAAAHKYRINEEYIAGITAIRRSEQAQMQAYMAHGRCLMEFLARALDDPHAGACGKCAGCAGAALLDTSFDHDLSNRAANRRDDKAPCRRLPAPAGRRFATERESRGAQAFRGIPGNSGARGGGTGADRVPERIPSRCCKGHPCGEADHSNQWPAGLWKEPGGAVTDAQRLAARHHGVVLQ